MGSFRTFPKSIDSLTNHPQSKIMFGPNIIFNVKFEKKILFRKKCNFFFFNRDLGME